MKFRRKWAEYDSTSSSSDDDDDDEQEEEEDQENEEKNAGEEEEDPELVGKQLLEEMNELGEEGNEEEDDEEEPGEKKPEELYDPEAEEGKVEKAWYHWSNERGPTANQDYQREIEERGLNLLLETLKGPGTLGDVVSYNHGGEYGRLEQVGPLSVLFYFCIAVFQGLERVTRCLQGPGIKEKSESPTKVYFQNTFWCQQIELTMFLAGLSIKYNMISVLMIDLFYIGVTVSSGNNILTLFSAFFSSPDFFSFNIDLDFLRGALAKVRLPPRASGDGGGGRMSSRAP